MSTNRLFRPDIDEHSFGSAYDPVLCGVAQGLARLFPPVEGGLPGEGAATAARPAPATGARDTRQAARRSGLANGADRPKENQRA